MAPKARVKLVFLVNVVGLLIFMTYLVWKYFQVQQKQKIHVEQIEENTYWSNIVNKLWTSDKLEPERSSSLKSEMWNSILNDYEVVKLWIIDIICLFIPRGVTSVIARVIQVICAALLVFIIITRYCGYFFGRMEKQKEIKSKKKSQKNSIRVFLEQVTFKKVMGLLTLVMLLISIPFEYMRLYQEQVAKKVATMTAGAPKECVPQEMSFIQSVKYYINWELSWIHDPCEKYHKALLVDPLWEISPLLVLWSALVRGILHPVELLFSSIGKCFKLLFSEIPAQWQPLMFILIVFVFLVVMMMTYNYRISLPFLLKIEPKTPVMQKTKSMVKHCAAKEEKTQNNLCAPKK